MSGNPADSKKVQDVLHEQVVFNVKELKWGIKATEELSFNTKTMKLMVTNTSNPDNNVAIPIVKNGFFGQIKSADNINIAGGELGQ